MFVQKHIRFQPSSFHLTCCSRGVFVGVRRHVGMLTSVRSHKNRFCSLFMFSYHAKWWRLLSMPQTMPPTLDPTTGRGMDETTKSVYTLTHTHTFNYKGRVGHWTLSNKESDKREREWDELFSYCIVLLMYCTTVITHTCVQQLKMHIEGICFLWRIIHMRPSEVSSAFVAYTFREDGQHLSGECELYWTLLSVFRQIALADLTIINKTDLVNESELVELRDTVRWEPQTFIFFYMFLLGMDWY